MFVTLLMQLFFLVSGQEPQAVLQPQAAAASDTQIIEGHDSVFDLDYFHSLPLASAALAFGPQRIVSQSLGVVTSAQSVYVVDKRTWSVLYEKNAFQQRPIASLTKLMTAMVLLDTGFDPAATITIAKSDYVLGGKIHVFVGEEFLSQDLWMVGLIASDNVAIKALVRNAGVSEQEFVAKMNQKANDLGLDDTYFVEVTGIADGNVASASNVAQMLASAVEYPDIADTLRRPIYSFKPLNKEESRTAHTTNALLDSFINEDPYTIMGGKTGFTHEAGYCLGVVVDGNAQEDDVIAIVLGAQSIESRFQDIKGLVDWVYGNYIW